MTDHATATPRAGFSAPDLFSMAIFENIDGADIPDPNGPCQSKIRDWTRRLSSPSAKKNNIMDSPFGGFKFF